MSRFPLPRDSRDDGCGPYALAVLLALLALTLWAVS